VKTCRNHPDRPAYRRDLCNACDHARRNANNPDRRIASSRAYGLRAKGTNAEQYCELSHEQGGRCAICRRKPGKRRLAVDHCHKTGQIRGLLCGRCNIGLGHFKDSPKRLRAAIAYLARSKPSVQ
jgi:hypothetical protein